MAASQQLLEEWRTGIQGRTMTTPTAQYPELSRIWEWNEENGQAIFPDPQFPHRRHVHSRFVESTLGTSAEGQSFIRSMTSNGIQFFVGCDDTRRKQSLLAGILKADIKKLRVTNQAGGISIEKTTEDLTAFDPNTPLPLLMSTEGKGTGLKPISILLEDVNRNSSRGWYGPGTYPCRIPGCTVSGHCMTASPVVNWAPGQEIWLNKRLTCASRDVVYLIHCQQCLNEHRWTTYVGETGAELNFHHRLAKHASDLVNPMNREIYPKEIISANARRMYAGEQHDPDELLRDPYCHWSEFHHGRENRRITILANELTERAERRSHEHLWVRACGFFNYNSVYGSGNLNF